jgi:uncharacterized protein YkwD
MRTLFVFALGLAACSRDIEWQCDDQEGYGWDASWETLELALWDATNDARQAGGICPSGSFDPVDPVTFDSQLTCAARGHALNLATNDFFDHNSLDGRSPGDRVDEAEYVWTTWSENISAGHPDAAETVQGWLTSETGHCENLLSSSVADGGFGYAYLSESTYGHYWVQMFGHR